MTEIYSYLSEEEREQRLQAFAKDQKISIDVVKSLFELSDIGDFYPKGEVKIESRHHVGEPQRAKMKIEMDCVEPF